MADTARGTLTIPMWLMPSISLTSTGDGCGTHGLGIFVWEHQFVIGARDQRDWPGCVGEIFSEIAVDREIAHQAVAVGRDQILLGIRRHRKGEHRQRLAAGDADAAQRHQADDARDVGVGPAAGIRPRGRRVIAEIGRQQHGAIKQVLDRRARHPQRKAAAGGVADQGQRGVRRGLAHDRDEIGKVVLELAEIADVAARARIAVAANIHRPGLDAATRARPATARGWCRRSIRTSHGSRSPRVPSPGRLPRSGGSRARCRRAPGTARTRARSCRSTVPRAAEMECSSGGALSGVAISATNSSAAKPAIARLPMATLIPPETIMAIMAQPSLVRSGWMQFRSRRQDPRRRRHGAVDAGAQRRCCAW